MPYAAAGAVLYLLIDAHQPAAAADVRNLLLVGAIVVAAAITPKILATAAPLTLVVLIAFTSTSPLVRTRTFFGVIEVRQLDGFHAEYSGTTLHGLQYTDSRRSEPSTYYSRVGPLASVFDQLRSRTDGARIGVVGLGVGTICGVWPGDDDVLRDRPAVVDIAQSSLLHLSPMRRPTLDRRGRRALRSKTSLPARLTSRADAFSDTVPADCHARAVQTYARTLRLVAAAFHLESLPARLLVAATARSIGLAAATLA
jgi:hypothetical protein